MTRPAGSASATAADLHRCHPAATAATWAPVVACTVAAAGHGRPGSALVTPWGAERCTHTTRLPACRDEGCQRFACRVYREGYEDGYCAGYAIGCAEGYAAGEAAGYQAGYAAGVAAAGR